MTDLISQLDSIIQSRYETYLQELIELCAQPSVSARGEGVRECANLVALILQRHGYTVQLFETPGNPIVVGQLAGASSRTLLFYNHYDVQPPEPLELWTTPPFQPSLRDGTLYARGVSDDKGEFIARLAAVDAVREVHGGLLPCNVIFVLEGEEEIGSPHVAEFVRQHTGLLACQAAVWEGGGIDPQGSPGMTLGLRGILSVELAVQTLKMDAHSGGAHALPNAAWRLLRCLEILKAPDERILIPGWYAAVKPPSALDLELIEQAPDREAWLRQTFGVSEFVNGMTGKDLMRAVFNPTCNIDGINAGYQGPGIKTVIPARARVKLDFRLVPEQDPEVLFDRLCAYLQTSGFADVEVKRLGMMWPYKASADDPFIVLTRETAEAIYQRPYQMEPLAGGSSPIYAFAGPLGNIPVVSAGIGYADSRAHSPDENMRIEDFINGTRHLARILEGFAGIAAG